MGIALLPAKADGTESVIRAYGNSRDESHIGILNKCDHLDGMFGTRETVCYCDEDLCNGSGTLAASAISVVAAVIFTLLKL